MVWQDATNYLRLERAKSDHGQGVYVWTNQDGNYNSSGFAATSATDLYLRINRVGNWFLCLYSEDGLNWNQIVQLTLPFQPNLEAGFTLINAGQHQPFYADFDSIVWADPEEHILFLPIVIK